MSSTISDSPNNIAVLVYLFSTTYSVRQVVRARDSWALGREFESGAWLFIFYTRAIVICDIINTIKSPSPFGFTKTERPINLIGETSFGNKMQLIFFFTHLDFTLFFFNDSWETEPSGKISIDIELTPMYSIAGSSSTAAQ